jgi:mevalonate kinase
MKTGKVRASAPGKLMLFGEHAVVYDYPCIVTAVDLRYFVTLEKTQEAKIVLDIPNLKDEQTEFSIQDIRELDKYQKGTSFVLAAVKHFYARHNIASGIYLSTSGPEISYGLGSSSAITVATIAALAILFEIEINKQEIFEIAYAAVLDVQQGMASGFDVAAAVFGGTIYYQMGGKIIEPLDVETLPIQISFSGKKVSTISYIGLVSQLYRQYPEIIGHIFDLMGNIVEQSKSALTANDWKKVGDLANVNQGLLTSLGVSTNKLANLVYAARENGSPGSKLSGAGGGDCIFSIVRPEDTDKIKRAVEHAGGEVVPLPTNADGVKVDIL